MKKRIIVENNPMETQVAVLEDDELVELQVERRGQERLVGNIYKGIVQNVLCGMQAAFVDIGLEKNAFLYAKDIQVGRNDFDINNEEDDELRNYDIKDLIKQGEEVMVQVFKEPGGTKGTRVTTNITLPGRMLVLMPTVDYIGVSRRITDETERDRLKGILEDIADEGYGIIARTVAIGKDKEDFITEYEFLKHLWSKLYKKNHVLNAPRLIHCEESLIYRTVRDMLNEDIDSMIIDNEDTFERATIMAEMTTNPQFDRIYYYDKVENIFDYYGITYQINKAIARKVWLKSGGYLIIDHTEALTVIDVNTGKFVGNTDFCMTALKTNLEAAVEVAKQIRLRNISGIIVVDFIDMLTEEDRQQLLDVLDVELAKDKTKSAIAGMSELGLVEITRKKERRSLAAIIKKDCPYCKGSGTILNSQTIILEIYKKVERILKSNQGATIAIRLHENVSACFNEHTKELFMDISGIDKATIFLCPISGVHEEHYEVNIVGSVKEFHEGKFFAFVG